jgi:hypothetical protein
MSGLLYCGGIMPMGQLPGADFGVEIYGIRRGLDGVLHQQAERQQAGYMDDVGGGVALAQILQRVGTEEAVETEKRHPDQADQDEQ